MLMTAYNHRHITVAVISPLCQQQTCVKLTEFFDTNNCWISKTQKSRVLPHVQMCISLFRGS